MSRVSRGEKYLMSLAQNDRCEMTVEGANYVIQRVDPYHDKPQKPTGLPDMYDGHTNTRCIKKSITFNALSGGRSSQTGPWDCYIAATPIARTNQFVQAKYTGGRHNIVLNESNTLTQHYGGVTIRGVFTTGNDCEWLTTDPEKHLGSVQLSNSEISGNMRLVSAGMEIIDGTAVINKQGVATTYVQNLPLNEPSYFNGYIKKEPLDYDDSVTRTTFTGKMIPLPPKNTADALVIPGARQWKVSEGGYNVWDLNATEIKMCLTNLTQPILFDESVVVGPNWDSALQTMYMPLPNYIPSEWSDQPIPVDPDAAPVTKYSYQSLFMQRYYDMNQSGIILSGLHEDATITLNVIFYVETAPTISQPELLSLAYPSPRKCDLALAVCSRIVQDEPNWVKLNENYTGEWFFNGIRDVVGKMLPWLDNASYIGKKVVGWIDSAGQNDGYIVPQTRVKGSVVKTKERERAQTAMKKAASAPQPPKKPPPKPKQVVIRSSRTGKPIKVSNKAKKRIAVIQERI